MAQTTLKPIVLSILLISTPILSQAHGTEQSETFAKFPKIP